MEKEILIAKIVASPSASSWSQAYNAGKLFAVISLQKENIEQETGSDSGLAAIGKETIENLEAEFFTIESKTLETVKTAVEKSIEKIPGGVKASVAVGAVAGNILYLFGKGKGKTILKRMGKVGEILTSGDSLSSSSGYLEDGDILILETSQFADVVDNQVLSVSILGHPVEIAENLAPLVHEREEAGASAIIIEYKKEETAGETLVPPTPFAATEPLEEKEKRLTVPPFIKKYKEVILGKIKGSVPNSLDHSKRLFLTISVLLGIIFLISVFFAVKRQSDQKTKVLYAQYYVAAQKKYDEGQSLLDLNKTLARDSFASAQKILLEGEPKFKNNSKEKRDMDSLLAKVNAAISSTSNTKQVSPQETNSSDSSLLDTENKSSALYAAKDVNDIYALDTTEISKNEKQIIKKTWGTPGGLGIYFGNVYVLDRSGKNIIKFVSTSDGFAEASYFTADTKPDISSAISMAIDGSIWVILKDGTVLKFTRGKTDNFNLTGLDKPFSSPTRIFTTSDLDKVYVLDTGNGRIVSFDKTGAYQSQYQSDLFKTAKDFEVNNNKIFLLNGSKIYKFDL